jgi:hypothetical protein
MLVGWGLVSDESPKQGQSSVMFWLFNEFQWVAMDQIALIFQWMDVTWCNQYLHKTLRGIAINWKFGNPLFKNYIYIHIYIHIYIPDPQKICLGALHFQTTQLCGGQPIQRGRPSHFASQSSDIPMAWWCRPSNCRWELHLWRLFLVKIYRCQCQIPIRRMSWHIHIYVYYIYTSEATKLQISPVVGIAGLQTTD